MGASTKTLDNPGVADDTLSVCRLRHFGLVRKPEFVIPGHHHLDFLGCHFSLPFLFWSGFSLLKTGQAMSGLTK